MRCSGEGLKETVVLIPAEFRVSVEDEHGPTDLTDRVTVSVRSGDGETLPIDFLLINRSTIWVKYLPRESGSCHVDVQLDGEELISLSVPVKQVH